MTDADVLAKDLLFATLDPTMRGIVLPGGIKSILSDTVGFISNLPTDLIAAFRATLEEVREADVILHVRDIAHPETEDQRKDVLAVLEQLGIEGETSGHTIIEIWNKIDKLDSEARAATCARAERSGRKAGESEAIALSAVTGEGIDRLRKALAVAVTAGHSRVELTLRPEEGALLAWVYDHGLIETREDCEDGSIRIRALLSPIERARLDQRLETGRLPS
jgi:GTPase